MRVKRLPVGPLQANCYILVDEATSKAVLIDPGGDAGVILGAIDKLGADLEHILLTHGHPDHWFDAMAIRKAAPKADILMHPADFDQLTGETLDIARLFYDMSGYQPMEGITYIEDGQRISFGESHLDVIHTPGHSPGGVSFYGDGLVFTGDALFAGSVGRTDLPGGSSELLGRSIRERLFALPEDTTVYPGHGPDTTIGDEIQSNPMVDLL